MTKYIKEYDEHWGLGTEYFKSTTVPSFLPEDLDRTDLEDITTLGDKYKRYLNLKTGVVHDSQQYFEQARLEWYEAGYKELMQVGEEEHLCVKLINGQIMFREKMNFSVGTEVIFQSIISRIKHIEFSSLSNVSTFIRI